MTERQLDYALSGYNVHDALELVERLIAERDDKIVDKEYTVPESLKIFTPDEYENLQKTIDKNTAQQQRIKEFKTLRRDRNPSYDDDNDNDEKVAEKIEESKDLVEEEELAPVKEDLDVIHKRLLFQMALYNEGIEEIDDPNKSWELTTEYEYLSVYSKTIFTEKDCFYGMKLVGTFDCSL